MKKEEPINPADRRRSIRFDTSEELTAVVHGVLADVENLSLTGACIVSNKPLPLSSRFPKPTFFIDNRSYPVRVSVTLRWTQAKGGRVKTGIVFDWPDFDRSPVVPVLEKFLS